LGEKYERTITLRHTQTAEQIRELIRVALYLGKGEMFDRAVETFVSDRNTVRVVSPTVTDGVRNIEILGNLPIKLAANVFVTIASWKVHRSLLCLSLTWVNELLGV
jgi:hypothetical protein